MPYYRTCTHCGAHYDPGEHHECDDHPAPEQEMARRPVAKKRTVYPREYNSEAYIRQKWLEFDMR